MIQSAVLKAFHEEKERSKQPGYVCTYDDYDTDYDVISYTQVVGEMGAPPRGYRTHGVHGPRGQHAPVQQPAAQEQAARPEKKAEGFSAGIL